MTRKNTAQRIAANVRAIMARLGYGDGRESCGENSTRRAEDRSFQDFADFCEMKYGTLRTIMDASRKQPSIQSVSKIVRAIDGRWEDVLGEPPRRRTEPQRRGQRSEVRDQRSER